MEQEKNAEAVLHILTDADAPRDHAARLASFFTEKGFFAAETRVTPQAYTEEIDADRKRFQAEMPGVPVFLYAQGGASYIARAYLAVRGDGLNGVVLAGTGYVSPGAGSLKVYGGKLRLLFGGTGAGKRAGSGPAMMQIKASVCGESHFAKLPKNLAVFLVSGAEDLNGDRGAGVRRVQEGMLLAGLKDISCKLYPDVADDLFAPEIADTFLSDVAAFFDAHRGTEVSTYAANKAYEEKKAAEKKDYEIDQILI